MYFDRLLFVLYALASTIASLSFASVDPLGTDIDGSILLSSQTLLESAGNALSTPEDVCVLETQEATVLLNDPETLGRRDGFHPNDEGLELRSSLGYMLSVNGARIYAGPIMTAQYLDILSNARDALKNNHGKNEVTNFYQFNHTGWTFEVVVTNGTLHYASLSAVVSRYMKLVPTWGPQSNITRTRVGRIDKKGHPFADIALIPSDRGAPISNEPPSHSVGGSDSTTNGVNVTYVTPFGSSWASQTLTGQELSIFRNSLPSSLPKRQTGLEQVILRAVAGTAFSVSVRLLEGPHGLIVRASIYLLVAVILLAFTRLRMEVSAAATVEAMHGPDWGRLAQRGFDIDSGQWELGKMTTNFGMRLYRGNQEGQLHGRSVDRQSAGLDADTWRRIMQTILSPLQSLDSRSKFYSLEGDIYGPANGNSTGAPVIIGRWELSALPAEDSP